jgi:hypothetical protein
MQDDLEVGSSVFICLVVIILICILCLFLVLLAAANIEPESVLILNFSDSQ